MPLMKIRRRHLCLLLAISGWLPTLVLTWHSRHRIASMFSKREAQPTVAERVRAHRTEMLSVHWEDVRLPIYFIGDSQIEGADWYALLHGKYAVRNFGVSGSRIPDAVTLSEILPEKKTGGVVFLSGINDLAAGHDLGKCLRDYSRLFEIFQEKVSDKPVLVVSLFPVSRDLGRLSIAEANDKVRSLNEKLRIETESRGFTFVDVFNGLSTDGKLDSELTSDGLHLNEKGYQITASEVAKALSRASLQNSFPDE